ncbi:MAG: DUF3501 family protein [Nitrospinae bacterium]|nr:DUF3501 family protein [Nitrospinota bacterium]
MKPLTPPDLLPYAEYELGRQTYRQRIIELKKRRRISVGDLITLIFENRETVLFQIQEMIRTERIFDPQKVQDELDVYNTLLPDPGELRATLFIEITDNDRIKQILDNFQDIDRLDTLFIQLGEEKVSGEFEPGHSKEDKISAVHFVRFQPNQSFLAQLPQTDIPASIRVAHEHYQAEAKVPDPLRREWLADLELENIKVNT